MTIGYWLENATNKLSKAQIESSRLDAELLLANATYQTREHLLTHGDKKLSKPELEQAEKWLQRRLKREPIAYILGHKEFYGRDFMVSPGVLIPRPESEAIIETLKMLRPETVIDIGTGSGCLAISAKLEMPNCVVIAADVSEEALYVARNNSSSLNAEIIFVKSDLMSGIKNINSHKPVALIANLPYVDKLWKISPETKFEPKLALFAEDGGLKLIKKLIIQSSKKLRNDDMLILEADERQHRQIALHAKKYGFKLKETVGLIQVFIKT